MLTKKSNTTIREENGYTIVRLHRTDIVKFKPNGEIILHSGKWRTPTTKRRMNEVSEEYNLHFHVYQKNKEWFICFKGETYTFEDGMIL